MTEQEQSSEVKEQEAEKSAAEEALEATAGPASEAEPTVPLHKHTALRDRAQAAEVAQARAEGQLAAINEAAKNQAPAVKSPMQTEIDRQTAEGIDESDMTFSPRVFKAELDHRDQVTAQTATAKATDALHATQVASTNAAKGRHEDWQTVVSTAYASMTPGEILDIEREGENFGEVAYAKAQQVLARNATVSKTEAAPEKKSESEAEEKKEEKVQTQDEILADLTVDPDAIRAAQL